MKKRRTGIVAVLCRLLGIKRKCPTCRWSVSYTEGTGGPLWQCTLHGEPLYVGQGYYLCNEYVKWCCDNCTYGKETDPYDIEMGFICVLLDTITGPTLRCKNWEHKGDL